MNEHDVLHLAPYTVIFVIPAEPKKHREESRYSMLVSYSDHCYTKAVGDSQHRNFDPIRYELSKRLPEIISSLIERKCSFAHGRNYFTINANWYGDYEIYFELFKQPHSKKLALIVHSAYIRAKQNLEKRLKWRPIRFSVLFIQCSK